MKTRTWTWNGKSLKQKQVTLKLGQTVTIYGRYGPTECMFVKASPKGYNFRNIKTNKTIFRRHFYDSRFSNKPIPGSVRWVQTWVPSNMETK